MQLAEWYRALNYHGNYDVLRFLGSNSGTAKSATFYSISSGPLLITQLSGTTSKHLKRHYCRGKTIYSSDSICSSKLLFGRAESFFFFLKKTTNFQWYFVFLQSRKLKTPKTAQLGTASGWDEIWRSHEIKSWRYFLFKWNSVSRALVYLLPLWAVMCLC